MKFLKIFLPLLFLGFFSCTDLEEDLREDITGQQAEELGDVDALLKGAYESLRGPFQAQEQFWALQELTTDEAIPPTRGGDWDDNGKWRAIQTQTIDAEHGDQTSTFNNLLQVVFNATNVLTFNPSPQQAAEARFLRAFAMFAVADGWGQVPFREPGENLLQAPQVLKGNAPLEFIISELNEILNDLPDGPASIGNKDAARVLLMKAHLHNGVFPSRESPKFDAGDMNKVITLADDVINSGRYSLSVNYFDNFAPNNDQISTENIFTNANQGGASSGNVRSRWMSTLHYNQNPSGWNGFTTLADFYDKFEDGDIRKDNEYPGLTDVSGIHAGFLIGQQYDQDGTALQDRNGAPLIFTSDVSLIETGNNLEVTGIRVIKYAPDYVSGDNADNDYVLFRYGDVLLMKAEAALRNGDAGTALTVVNELRANRGAPALASINLDVMLDERGREMFWEGYRRQDLIRFGKYLDAWQEKPAGSATQLLQPIPNSALAVNPNLEQNPGY